VLSDLPVPTNPRVLVDYRDADDAGVFVLDDTTALVQTVDFFTPIVDDPDAYGRIAAANAVSDVYAMGATPITALAIAAFPARDFPAAVVKAIFAGGLSVLRECGVALLGGHTVQDTEVKFGYAVTGVVSPRAVWTNAGARAGDALLLTKPLGTGIIATAAKFGRTDAATLAGAVRSMQSTNRIAAQVLRTHGADVHGCTDITGFGLLGHASELAAASRVRLEIDAATLPALPGALALALGNKTGGLVNNRGHFGPRIVVQNVADDLAALAFDPQTSGGLLASVSAAQAPGIVEALAAAGVEAAVVGSVHDATDSTLVVLR
jgi:selenide,water dikinase